MIESPRAIFLNYTSPAVATPWWLAVHSPFRQVRGPEPVEGLTLAATPTQPRHASGYQTHRE